MKPLAFRMRPKSFNDVFGQDNLVGENGIIKKMLDNNKLTSIILYGEPGCGKTTIAEIIANNYSLNHYFFNASIDTKDKLKEISQASKYYDNTILIIDEIHRMKKDIQDYLLSFMEDGSFIIVGLTTSNPYHSINPAIRSRCLLFKLNKVEILDLKKIINNALISDELEHKITLDDDVIEYIIYNSNNEVRQVLNSIELLSLSNNNHITLDEAKKLILRPSLKLDKDGDNYYEMLSALQKSIRGSDCDAAIHYLARLLTLGDLEIICRRLTVIAYEDVGLANPMMGVKAVSACEAAKNLGMPEARIPLSALVIDMAISPKSNTAETAIDKALFDFENGNTGDIPDHLKNGLISSHKAKYLYPHDFPSGVCKQQYLPREIKDIIYYNPKENSSYEKALKERNELIKKVIK